MMPIVIIGLIYESNYHCILTRKQLSGLVKRVKELAAKHGLAYECYVQNLVHDALDQVAKAS
jgi:predicted DNA binding CopG/RHH family protein